MFTQKLQKYLQYEMKNCQVFSSAAACSRWSLQYRRLMSVCCQLVHITTSTFFIKFSKNLTHVICVPIRTKLEQIF